jgi:zinc protease
MKRAFLSLMMFMLLAGLSLPGQQGVHKLKYPEMRSFTLPVLEKAELGNGLKLRHIKQDKLPIFQVTIWLKGGQAYDPANRIGLMEVLTGTLRVGGTEKHSPDEMDRLLESKGITLNVYSTSDSIQVSLSALSEDFDQAVALAAELLRLPAFSADKLGEVKTRTGSGISRRNDEPAPIARREFQRLVYGEAFAAEAVMEYTHLDNIERADLQKVHKMFFAPDNMMLGFSGPLSLAEVQAVVEKHFGDWQAKSAVPPLPQQIKSAEGVRLAFAEKSDLTQSYIHMGYLGDLWKAEEAALVQVFNAIFSQGFDSRLFARVRTKEGLTYGVGGSIGRNYSYPGVTSYSTFTKSGSTFKAIRAMQEEMQRIRQELVSAQELKDAKDYLLNSHVFKFASPEQVLFRKMSQEFYNLPAEIDDKFVDKVKAVTAEDIKRIAEQYLHPEKMIIMVLGKEADLDDKLENWAPVKKVDIAIPPPALKESFPEITPEGLKKGQTLLTAAVNGAYKGYAKTLKTSRMVMNVTVSMPQGQIQMKMTDSVRYPDFNHQVIEVMGMKMVNVTTPKGGYMEQMGQKRPIPAEQVAESRFARFYDLMAKPESFQVQFYKEDKIDDQVVNVLLVREENGSRWKKLYLHQKSGLLLAEESMMDLMGQGKKPARTLFADYRTVKGLPFAHAVTIEADGKPFMQSKVEGIEVNPTLDDSLFKIE